MIILQFIIVLSILITTSISSSSKSNSNLELNLKLEEGTNLNELQFESLLTLEEEFNRINPLPPWSNLNSEDLDSLLRLSQQHDFDKRSTISYPIAAKTAYPPSTFIDINNLTTLYMISAASVERMMTWVQDDGGIEWTAWWQLPVLGLALSGLDHAFGNQANKALINTLLTKNVGENNFMIDKYVDDQSWWAMFALRAYQTYGQDSWLQSAKFISSNNTIWWTDECGGGVLWLTYVPNVKNTITNALYFSVLARLYRYTGDVQYYQYAINTLNWWLSWGFETSTGRVYDTITYPDCSASGLQSFTYNSGSMLFGLADLYYGSGNTTLLDLGRTIAYAAMRDFTDTSTGVLAESCEKDAPPTSQLPPGCQQDEVTFKGILTLGLAELYLARPDENIYNFLNIQLLSATFNDVDNSWLWGEWWYQFNETTAGPKTQINTLCMIAAAAQVNADYISKVNSTTKSH